MSKKVDQREINRRDSPNTDGRAVNGEMTHSTARVALLVVSDLGVGAKARQAESVRHLRKK